MKQDGRPYDSGRRKSEKGWTDRVDWDDLNRKISRSRSNAKARNGSSRPFSKVKASRRHGQRMRTVEACW